MLAPSIGFCPVELAGLREEAHAPCHAPSVRQVEWTIRVSRILRWGELPGELDRAEGEAVLDVPPRLSAREKAVLEARRMRRYPTPSEALLWRELRGGKLGVRFVRQAVIGRFIVDFFAPELRLVGEVDGGYHAQRKRAD